MNDPIRLELDFPFIAVSHFNRLELANGSELQNMIANLFTSGEILTVHMVVESTNEIRKFCKWETPDSQYHSRCNKMLSADGICKESEEHAKKDIESLQIALPILGRDSE